MHGDDLDHCWLELQLQSLAAQFREDPDRPRLLLHDIVNYLKTHTAAERVLFSEVVSLVRIVLVNPGFEVKLTVTINTCVLSLCVQQQHAVPVANSACSRACNLIL